MVAGRTCASNGSSARTGARPARYGCPELPNELALVEQAVRDRAAPAALRLHRTDEARRS